MGKVWVTLAGPAAFESAVKGSRFVARAAPVETPEAALAFLAAARDPQASHNCWAYRLGQLYRFSDDGEPGGTAGQPILRAVEGQGLDGVAVVVTRYFGGVKLGAGGLARAYGGAAAECLRRAEKHEVKPMARLRLEAPFEFSNTLFHLLREFGAEKLGEAYTERGLRLEVRLEAAVAEALRRALDEATGARVGVAVLSSE